MNISNHSVAFNLIINEGVPINTFLMSVSRDNTASANVRLTGENVTAEVAQNLVVSSPEICLILKSLVEQINLLESK